MRKIIFTDDFNLAVDRKLIRKAWKVRKSDQFPEGIIFVFQYLLWLNGRWEQMVRLDNMLHQGTPGTHIHYYKKQKVDWLPIGIQNAERIVIEKAEGIARKLMMGGREMVRVLIVEDIHAYPKKTNEYIRNVGKGEIPIDKKMAEKTIVITPELFSKIFSPERLRIMLHLKEKEGKNIYQIAKSLHRKYEAVHRDIRILKGYGIVKTREKENKVIPLIDQEIVIPAFIHS